MYRAISLLVVLAHLGVASTPCFESAAGLDPLLAIGGGGTGPAPVQSSEQDERFAHHAAAVAIEGETKSTADADPHAHHQHGDSMQAESEVMAEPDEEVTIALHELRAPCLCGCSRNNDSAGSTTSPRLGFALFPAAPELLPEVARSVDATAAYGMPAPLADSFDHVPILFS